MTSDTALTHDELDNLVESLKFHFDDLLKQADEATNSGAFLTGMYRTFRANGVSDALERLRGYQRSR